MRNIHVYETHVKGLTANCPLIKDVGQSYFLRACDDFIINHLLSLDINTIQFMPIFDSADTYWGYDPTSWTKHNPKYGTLNELRFMVKKFQANGIKVIFDVVYNHTHNSRPIKGVKYYDWDVTGCGNTVDVKASLPAIMKSMTYWLRDIGIDGMRFDLANVLGRENGNFTGNAQFFKEIEVFNDKLLIMEPWDCNEVSPYWAYPDWVLVLNGEWRDAVRKNGDISNHTGRPEEGLMNFITCHDGLTMLDLINKIQWFSGTEQSIKNHTEGFMSALRNSCNWMMLGGDEMGNSQDGDGNTYLEDNIKGYINWDNYVNTKEIK